MTPAAAIAAKATRMLVPRETTWAAAIDESSYPGEHVLIAIADERGSLVIDIPAASWNRDAAVRIICTMQPQGENT